MKFIIHSSAPIKRPLPIEGMVERRNQILGMCYGMKSPSYLLEEKKLREYDLIGEKEFIDDWFHIKYSKWQNVPMPHNYKSPLAGPLEFRSPVKTPKRSQAEQEDIENRLLSMYSLTLLRI